MSRRGGPRGRRSQLVHELIAWGGRLHADSLPPAAERAARRCLTDAWGNIVVALEMPEAREACRLVEPWVRGNATIVGGGGAAPAATAAFANAVRLDLLEAQDGHRSAGLHPCEGVVPAALATAEEANATFGELLAAVVFGYEVTVRVGQVLFPEQTRRGFYPDGTSGPLGAAAAAARLLGADATTTERAIAAAAGAVPISLVQGIRSPAKSLVAGLAAELGVRAAMAAVHGLGGDLTVFEPPHGYFDRLSSTPSVGRLRRRPVDRWAIEEVYLKPYPGGRHAHAALDALRTLLGDRPVPPTEIRAIEIETYAAAVALTGSVPGPKSPLAELTQSTPYLVAAAAADGLLGPDRFAPSHRWDPAVLGLARRVRLREEPRFSRSYPRRTEARVRIVTRDGRTRTAQVRHRWGDPELPMTDEEMRSKFVRGVAGRSDAEGALRAWDRLRNADRAACVRRLVHAMESGFGRVRRRENGLRNR